ncbi:MAG: iron chelate uptake ABC transporter family permease subunit [Tissierellia bacterium]|nr:iron chelate uptake ABC transporter family permease subunit [Tissierellia bacterium]
MKEIFGNSIFILVLTGTFLLGIAGAMVGSVTVLNKKSLIGDAIGHSGFPGIILAFMIFSTRSPYILLAGAVATGMIAYFIISLVDHTEKRKSDTSLAVVLSGFFGLGMALKSYIQGNVKYQGASQSGLSNYIFGQAAFMTREDIKLIISVSILAICLLLLFYKEIKLYVFDPEFLMVSGFNRNFINFIIILMTIAVIAAGLKVVGSILISSILIAPTVTAMQWTDKYKNVIIIATIIGGVSSFIGTLWSTMGSGISTGPAIVIIMSLFALLSLVFGTNGVIQTMIRRRRYAK